MTRMRPSSNCGRAARGRPLGHTEMRFGQRVVHAWAERDGACGAALAIAGRQGGGRISAQRYGTTRNPAGKEKKLTVPNPEPQSQPVRATPRRYRTRPDVKVNGPAVRLAVRSVQARKVARLTAGTSLAGCPDSPRRRALP